ncbi:MAG: tRNA uridine-5-carboxymethylaminomethyl(34) synthesis enzyme MnmG [Gemmatimonadales bacterium]|nr:tRNA uridine-5-carboxymethylaminomethyl(34) synthesis enzyme MnmG [Gemmatimonadales bacterium]
MPHDVIVIGGGHAGAEACALAARAGARVLLLTQNLETIGQMSCNPAIGGIAKGTVVREVDALGGIMARATDRSRIQFRMLNTSKGPAVWSPRAQCDRGLYRRAVRSLLEGFERVSFAQGTVARLLVKGGAVFGVVTTDGREYHCRAVVLTAGTFLRGRIHVGLDAPIPAGRAGEGPAVESSESIADLGLTIERFKTGTPPRIDGRTVNLDNLARQDGDPGEFRFSFLDQSTELQVQLPCWLTRTGPELQEVITRHLERTAHYGGAISGRGPRYCPSIEDKIVRFPNASRHQVFLEPEGLDTHEMYVNGLSTSLPPAVQLEYLRTVPGLESVEMTRPGYAIEYDYFPPTQLDRHLAVKSLQGLYFAGQINGTTGYEEAAGQGALAGLNAARFAAGEAPVSLGRDQAMIGVMADDLVSRGVDEPYRLFTSRAEFRLLLRQDNALRRLAPMAIELGLYTSAERELVERKLAREEAVLEGARGVNIAPAAVEQYLDESGTPGIAETTPVLELAKRPEVSLVRLLELAGVAVDGESAGWAEIEVKYAGYLGRERQMAGKLAEMEGFALPEGLVYTDLEAISWEAREKLGKVRPTTLGQAGRIPGVNPSDLQGLVLAVLRHREAAKSA